MTAPSDMYQYGELVLDSGDFKYGDKNSPIFQFDQNIDEHQYFQVHRVIIPTTYYVFDITRTTMNVDGSLISWPAGNYTVNEWITLVSPSLPGGMTVTYDPVINKLVFRRAAAFTILFSSSVVNGQGIPIQRGAEEIGFVQDVTATSSVVTGMQQITSPFVVNFSGPNFVYMRSHMASVFNNSDLFFSNTTITTTGGDILAMIPIDENRNSVTHYIDRSGHMIPWRTTGNKRVNVYFTLGRRLDILDFNGTTFQLRIHGYSLKESGPYRFNF